MLHKRQEPHSFSSQKGSDVADLTIKRHDTKKIPEGTIGYVNSASDDSALASALADVSTVVTFIMKSQGGGAVKVNAAADIVDAATRTIRYQWIAADVDTEGTFDAEWQVVWPDGKPETFPTAGYLEIEIVADLDDAGAA